MPEESIKLDERDFREAENHSHLGSGAETISNSTENNEETIRRVLGTYHIGHKLRQLRLRKKIALVDLGKHTHLSASMLSQLENGKLIPTLPTLARIAMVFDIGLDFFFSEKKTYHVFSVVHAEERLKFPEGSDSPIPGCSLDVLTYGAVDKSLSAYLVECPRESSEAREHFHEGSEFIHIVSGALNIRYQGEDHVLHAGDSVYFDSAEPHSYHGVSDEPAKVIVVTTPPRPQ